MNRKRDSKGHFIKDGTFKRTKNCVVCNKQYSCRSQFKYDTSSYCSIKCLGVAHSIQKKGKNPYARTSETNANISKAKLGKSIWGGERGRLEWLVGERNNNWKGDEVGYNALHKWVNRTKGKASECTRCGDKGGEKGCHWANLSGRYLRDADDFVSLCPSCHKKLDLGQIIL